MPDHGADIGFDGIAGPSTSQILSLIIVDSYDSAERDARLLWVAMNMGVEGAPKNVSEFAMWLDISESTARRKWRSLFQCFQASFNDSWRKPPLSDGKRIENDCEPREE